MPSVPDFVRNVMGSSAGAGSGEFHVYRHLRRKEYARQKYLKESAERVSTQHIWGPGPSLGSWISLLMPLSYAYSKRCDVAGPIVTRALSDTTRIKSFKHGVSL